MSTKMATNSTHVDRESKMSEFENTKVGLKGLVDAGIAEVPEFFKLAPEHRVKATNEGDAGSQLRVPVIDLEGLEGERRMEIVDEIRRASGSWGMFYTVNHGVPLEVMENMLEGNRRFHEQPKEAKMEFYSRDPTKNVRYYASFHPFLKTLLWKDSIAFELESISSADVPLPFREALFDYVKHIIKLKDTLSALLSEALGLDSDYLERIECMEAQRVLSHYFPACPEPEVTISTTQHSDQSFLTILSTNNVDGLQLLHQSQWVDVTPMEGALIVIIGDMLQVITNDLFKSNEHRVLAGRTGRRLSVACFFYPSSRNKDRKYGVIEELLVGEDHPSPYKELSFSDYLTKYQSKGVGYPKSLVYVRQ